MGGGANRAAYAKRRNVVLILMLSGSIVLSIIYHLNAATLTAGEDGSVDYAASPTDLSTSLSLLAKAESLEGDYRGGAHVHKTGARLVAIGDIHGDYEQAINALRVAGLISDTGHWAGGDSVLVQTGDLVDRGHDSIGVLALFQRLKDEARRANGDVLLLLGNHELMNLQGDYRYISRNELRRIGLDQNLPEEPQNSSSSVLPIHGMRGIGKTSMSGLRRWRYFLSPSQPLGRFVRRRQTAAILGDGNCRTVFVHAGVLPGVLAQQGMKQGAIGPQLLDALNQGMAQVLESCSSENCEQGFPSPGSTLMGDDGPVWYRGYAMDDEIRVCSRLVGVLQTVHAQRMVIGHTVQADGRLHTRCGGRLHLIDVGISRAYLGATAAWECTQEGGVVGLYPDERQAVVESFSRDPVPFNLQRNL
eukprot:jgi/Tetstr1/465153/TSEL_009876.t2